MIVAAVGLAACGQATRRGTAELHSAYYRDDEGLQVVTVGAAAAHRLRRDDRLQLEVLLDRVDFEPVDAVSSASASATSGLKKERIEAGAAYSAAVGGDAHVVGTARASREPDYLSFSGSVGGDVELFERNLRLAASLGVGHDRIDPTSVAMGDETRWPASHDRVTGRAEMTQLLGPRADLSLGVGLAWQSGALSSPYRRSLVWHGSGFIGNYEPEAEVHPGARTRFTGFGSGGWYLGRGVALHGRLGGYADSWGVLAIVPEVEAAVELGERVLATLGYRYYRQGRASFYEERYDVPSDPRTGDRRLGVVEEHLGSAEVMASLLASRSLSIVGSYGLSRLAYVDLGTVVLAHIVSLGVSLAY